MRTMPLWGEWSTAFSIRFLSKTNSSPASAKTGASGGSSTIWRLTSAPCARHDRNPLTFLRGNGQRQDERHACEAGSSE